MTETHFERLARVEMGKILEGTMRIQFVDPLKAATDLARFQGKYAAFEEAIAMSRRAARADVDPDDI